MSRVDRIETMRKKIILRTTLMLFSLFVLTTAFYTPKVKADTIFFIRADGSIDPPTSLIFTADNITYVLTGDLWECSIIIQRDNIVLDGEGRRITPFDFGIDGVTLSEVSNVTVQDIFVDMTSIGPGGTGIYLSSSSNCTIKETSTWTSGGTGIYLSSSPNCTIKETSAGLFGSDTGIYLHSSSYCTIDGCIIKGDVTLDSSSDNTIVGNNMSGSSLTRRVRLLGNSSRNLIFHNNFDPSGSSPVQANGLVNFFNVDYPWGGNYWSGYHSQDVYGGEFQDIPGSDGIWDHPYIFDANNTDRYPFTQRDSWKTLPPLGYPVITRLNNTPTKPCYNEEALVTAKIIDDVAVDYALLSYTQAAAWHNVSMNRLADIFNASIPAQPYSTLVQYKIYAVDTGGNWTASGTPSYTVGDSIAPEVIISKIPAYPLPMQTVTVFADVTEPVDASGVKSPVFFSYRVNSGSWWNTTMVFNGGLSLYEATIPAYEKHDFVEYFVKALDNAGNTNTIVIHHYEVLRCDANHNGVVDVYDIHMIAKAWESKVGEPEYKPEADIDEDGVIDETDLRILNMQYGKDP